MHVTSQPQRITAGRGDDQLDVSIHVSPVEISNVSLDLEAPVVRLDVRFQAHPVDGDRAHVLQLDWPPQADGYFPSIWVGQARVSRGGIRPQLAIVEGSHHVMLLVRLRFDWRVAADDEKVLGLQVRGQVEAKWREVTVMGAQQLAVEPGVGREKRPAEAQQNSARVIRPSELGPVPNRLVTLVSRKLARNLDRLPPHALADRQALGFSLAERHPQRLPTAELTDSRRPLCKWKEQAIAHPAVSLVRDAANAPSAVVQTMTGF